MRAFSLIAAAAALFLSACDRHEWESKDGNMGTKELYVHHGEHGGDHGEHGEHGEHHGDDHGDHGKAAEHKEEGEAH
ncbi:hypothetical protein AAFN60_13250 [Roseibacillus persicicus]|uniref:Uncharacterized protein n=1 Tax=Roseibacillus persicicus TaxID=454148 RepID=A0A918WI39_9BACT|nr:hypothetical protein [Roseibacillus persicicus]GHC48351.1 hypothetical protein GCM10007100_12790 [Roseibacillus persicicus]